MVKSQSKRIGIDEYFLQMAEVVCKRGTCPRARVGCVLVKDKRVFSTGFNGALPGESHCEDVGCELINKHCVRTVHAEMNAVVQAAKYGSQSTDGMTVYTTHSPCQLCFKILAAAGTKRIVAREEYRSADFNIKAACRKSAIIYEVIGKNV
jgi:dCMP deaminase